MLSQIEFPWNFAVKDAIKILSGAEKCDLVAGVFMEPPERSSPENTDNRSSNEDQLPFFPISDEYFERYAEILFANYRRTNSRSSIIKLSLLKEERLVKKPSSLFPQPNYTQYIGKTPTQIFELFFDEEVINFIHLATIRNASKRNYNLSSLSPEEIRKFLAILLLSGYNKISRPPACYWEAPDVRNELVANSMHQERFIEIYEYINFELQPDMTEGNENDRVWMLRPLITLLQKRFVVNLPPEEIMDFDDCMVDSFRRFNYKELRHIPFGYKVSCLNTPSGYLIDFYVHNTKINDGLKYANEIGVAAAPLLLMLDRQPNKIRNLPYKIYFGDLKSNMTLLTELKQRGYTATGIFSLPEPEEGSLPIESCNGNTSISSIPEPNEKYPAIPMESCNGHSENTPKCISPVSAPDEKCPSLPTGSHCDFSEKMYFTSEVEDGEYEMITWCNELGDLSEVSSSSTKNMPNSYEESIIGTDTMKKQIEIYRIGICDGRKWYWPLFTWLLDVAVHNAWLLMQKTGSDISQLDFRRSIVRAYLDEKSSEKPPFPARNASLLS